MTELSSIFKLRFIPTGIQERLGRDSFLMDEPHLLAAVRYVELNPVRAGLCTRPEDWRWSSVRAHLHGSSDGIVDVRPMLELVNDWREYLAIRDRPETIEVLRSHTSTGRPAGNDEFITDLEKIAGRPLRKRRPGPRPKG